MVNKKIETISGGIFITSLRIYYEEVGIRFSVIQKVSDASYKEEIFIPYSQLKYVKSI